MPLPSDRFVFAGVTTRTEVLLGPEEPLFFVDLIPGGDEHGDDIVTVGWNADRTKFGVWLDGRRIHPEEEIT